MSQPHRLTVDSTEPDIHPQPEASDPKASTTPDNTGWVLASLVAVATVANLGLAAAPGGKASA